MGNEFSGWRNDSFRDSLNDSPIGALIGGLMGGGLMGGKKPLGKCVRGSKWKMVTMAKPVGR